jgi:hypothetical protein
METMLKHTDAALKRSNAAPSTPRTSHSPMGARALCLPAGAACTLPLVVVGAICALLLLLGAAAAAAQVSVRPICAAPAPGHVSCLALRALGAPQNRSPERGALSPEALHKAYALPTNTGTVSEAQTIALVDAYNDPNAETDLGKYDSQYGLEACTEGNGCFREVNAYGEGRGSTRPPKNSGEWSVEIATDIEMAHAICQNCHIVLVEAMTDEYAGEGGLEEAEETAAAIIHAASSATLDGEISNSWGGEEPEPPAADSSAFNHPGIVVTASAGDDGYLNWDKYNERNNPTAGYFDGPDYPASSPHVVAVGGTSLTLSRSDEWLAESVWNDGEKGGGGGGGCSAAFTAPTWQQQLAEWSSVGCDSARAVADVSADADPETGVSVYDSTPEPEGTRGNPAPPEWLKIGGTSVASPIIAAAFALAGGAHGVNYPAATLYAHVGSTTALHDVTAGGNGQCDGAYGSCSGALSSPLDCGPLYTICHAGTGYDGPTGVGTPNGLSAFEPIAGEVGGPGSGSGGNGPGGATGGSSGGGSGGSGSGSGVATPGTQSKPSGTAGATSTQGPPRISRLALTLRAIAALNHSHPKASALAFTFKLSAVSKVQVTLQQWMRVHHHWRWVSLPGAATIAALAGSDHGRLTLGRRLDAGRYRLTLTPVHGIASSLAVVIG